jgi:hypothetical protein
MRTRSYSAPVAAASTAPTSIVELIVNGAGIRLAVHFGFKLVYLGFKPVETILNQIEPVLNMIKTLC